MLGMIDTLLNRFTMYRIVLYCLIAYVVFGLALSLTGTIVIPARDIIVSIVVLLPVMYVCNWGFAKLLQVSVNQESWLISALILVCILSPQSTLNGALKIALAGIIAIACKFFVHYRGINLFNPAALAAVIVSVAYVLPVTWWIGVPSMIPITLIGGLLIVRKTRRFSLVIAFLVMGIMIACYVDTILGHQALSTTLHDVILSGPLLFMGTIMLTEPSTLPASRLQQIYYGLLVGIIYSSALSFWRFTSSPQAALIVGNVFTLLVAQRFGAQLILRARTKLAPNVYDFAFSVPSKQRLAFMPGQYLEWTLPHTSTDSRGNRRTFSIASCPADSEVHICLKVYEPSSSFKKALLSLQPGQSIRASRPAGDFTLPTDPRQPIVFIAGGIGITPFHSMITSVVAEAKQRDITLVYVTATAADFAFGDTFKRAEKFGVKTHYLTGRLQPDDLKQFIIPSANQKFYVSGPDGFVRAYKKMLVGLHVPIHTIRTDHFSGY